MPYYTSNEEHPIDILNIKGLEAKVKARIVHSSSAPSAITGKAQ